ncbi:RidA family protein [Alteromonas lipolytica]|uniref:RidA family protein n=1 Tax=Alteromonas lipolytica TaxID=1856405 RepID=UPI001E65AC56|nr:RidA family protein [Alteromonas lipolytica]
MNLVKLTLIILLAGFSQLSLAKVKYYPHPNANAPYSLATQVDNVIYLSGQIPLDENGDMPETMTAQSQQVMTNIKNALRTIGLGMEDIFKCTVMIDDIKKWPDFNAVYTTYFSKGALPARSAFGVDGLPLGAMVEVECMAHLRRM